MFKLWFYFLMYFAVNVSTLASVATGLSMHQYNPRCLWVKLAMLGHFSISWSFLITGFHQAWEMILPFWIFTFCAVYCPDWYGLVWLSWRRLHIKMTFPEFYGFYETLHLLWQASSQCDGWCCLRFQILASNLMIYCMLLWGRSLFKMAVIALCALRKTWKYYMTSTEM